MAFNFIFKIVELYMNSLLFDGDIKLEKMQMKGGWTYALLPEVVKGGRNNFGWTKLDASIDGYEMKNVSLMPIKGGRLFLAVKAGIRKQIKKEAGDIVRIKLYGNRAPETVSEADFHEALADDPQALQHFTAFPKKEQKAYLTWIFAAQGTDSIISRMADAINDIADGKRCRAADKKSPKES
jgi:hypothetical protein